MRTVLLCLVSGLCLGSMPSAALPLVLEPDSGAYAHATVSQGTTTLESGARVDGDVAGNDDVRLKAGSRVDGDARATGEIVGGGVVTGVRREQAEPVPVPAIPSLDELRSQADRVIQGPWIESEGQTLDDVVFVEGNVHFRARVNGTGTIIATGDIRFDGSGAVDPECYLSLIALGDVRFASRRTFRGVVRAGRDVDVESGASVQGVLVAGRTLHLKKDAAVAWVPPDREPPELVLESPLPLQYIEGNTIQPEIVLKYEDSGSGVDPESVGLFWDDTEITVLCDISQSDISPSVAQCLLPNQYPDTYTLRAEVSDLAGNTAQEEFELEIRKDRDAPDLRIVHPADDALVNTAVIRVVGTVADEGGLEQLTVVGEAVDPDSEGTFQKDVTLEEGANSIFVSARDVFGRVSSHFLSVTLDTVPPNLRITEPAQREVTTNSDLLVIQGEVNDEVELDRLEVDGTAIPLEYDRYFRTEIRIPPQGAQVSISAFDRAGNETREVLYVRRFSLPIVTIESPQEGERVQTASVSITGSVSPDVTEVLVNAVPATLADGRFVSEPVEIGAGRLVEAVATGETGLQAVDVIRLFRDVAPPDITILDPEPDSEVHGTHTAVFGLVSDAGAAILDGRAVEVRVNGILAEVRNGTFFAPAVPITVGWQSITAYATDAAGRTGSSTLTVHSVPAPDHGLIKTAGDLQTAQIGEELDAPLAVAVKGRAGTPAEGVPVVFRVVRGNGEFPTGGRQLVVLTDSSGAAATEFRLGTRAGIGNHVVEVSSPGSKPQRFHLSARPGPAAGIYVDSGDQQAGLVDRKLPHPFVAAVTDRGFNRLEGVPVTFRVVRGSGTFSDGSTEALVSTTTSGLAAIDLVLGAEDGVANNVVDAFLEDHPDRPFVSFGATGKAGGAPEETTISGVVLDNSNQPVPGVAVYLKGHPHLDTTGPDGRFRIEDAPVGALLLEVDGATTERAGSWPHLEFELTTVPGRDNTVGMPIYLVQLDESLGVNLSETEGGRIEIPSLPGFALDIAPGSVTFPDGSRAGRVFVSQVHADKVPMVPNFGQQPKFVLTIQPAGAHFDPPARLSLPNVDGLGPGEITEMYSFDHDLGRFVGIGTASVTEDGTQIVSDLGTGVVKAGWHCGGNPAAQGTTYDCPTCQICDGSQCVPGCASGATNQVFPFAEMGLVEKAGCDDCQDTRCRKNSRCSFWGCVGDEPRIAKLEITQGSGEPVTDVIYENSTTHAEFRAEVDKGNCDVALLSWDLEGRDPKSGNTFRRTGDGVNPFQTTLPIEGEYKVTLTANCGGCNRKALSKEFLVHRLLLDFDFEKTDVEISDDGRYSENAAVKIEVVSSVTEEVATSFSGDVDIFEDETRIYGENGGSLPATVQIENGRGEFCAISMAEGIPGGTEPLPAFVRTSEFPLVSGPLIIPQWVRWKPIDPIRTVGEVVDWAEALNSDILSSSTGDFANAVAAVGKVELLFLPGKQGEAFGNVYRVNIFRPGTRNNLYRSPPCGFSQYPGFTGVVTHEVRHVYGNYLLSRSDLGTPEIAGRPPNDDDDDRLPEIVDLAPFDTMADSDKYRPVCIYSNQSYPWRAVKYSGDSSYDPQLMSSDPNQRPADTSWARETDASQFAELHANRLVLEARPNPDLKPVCR